MESFVYKESDLRIIIELIRLLNENNDLRQMIKTTTKFLKEWSGCEAVGIRLKEGEDYPYFETIGFQQEFIELENYLCSRNLEGQIKKDKLGNPKIECMCGNIICGRFDINKPFFTKNGSFWSNCTTDLLANTTDADLLTKTRNRCNGDGYESVALIALKTEDETFGLIQLNDKRKNRFTLNTITLLEQFAISISLAVSKQITNKALLASKMRYSNMLDNMLEGAQIVGFDWKYLYVNDSFVKHSKYSREELLSHTVLELYPGIENTEVYNIYNQCFNERVSIHMENEFVFPDKSIGWFVLSFQPVPEGIFILSIDITQRKLAELELEKQNKKLLSMNKELEQFAYITSHDLQEPLKSLTCFAELVYKEYKEKLDNEGEIYLDFILKSSERMKLLIQGLLDYSRIGKENNFIKVDCNEIVNEVLTDLGILIKDNNVKITVSNLPVIKGLKTELRQLFQNLIHNSIKFRTKDLTPEISIDACKKNNMWHFSIQDNGIGIDTKDKDKIFLMFKRLHNRNEYDGTGIGLSICKKIVDQHNGSIWIESKINEGSTFYFTLQ